MRQERVHRADRRRDRHRELVAEAIHDASERKHGPFVVVDCGALSHDLAESELFGHERGAFTGADTQRVGAFESAYGGTIFLDEVGELPLGLQPLLLRALENRTIRRVGSNDQRPIDVRVIAASHRDLRGLVNDKRFRADLFYRLNVIRIEVPPLRERAGDVELLASSFWHTFRPSEQAPLLEHPRRRAARQRARQKRRRARCASRLFASLDHHRYQQAKERAVWEWERHWVEQLVAANGGNLSRAARAAKMGRSHLREIARRHGVVTRRSATEVDGDY